MDFWPSDELTLIATGGHTQLRGIELTGQGAAQTDDWTYNFVQGRLLYKDWFAQVICVRMAGPSFVLGGE